jgi:integrase
MSRGDGITRRRRKDNTIAYMARPCVKGKVQKARTFDTLREAREWKREVEKRPILTEETCASFAARWLDQYVIAKSGPTRGRHKSDRTLETYRANLRRFTMQFGDLKLGEVDRQMARRFALSHPAAAKVARALFADALDDGLVVGNPFQGLRLKASSRKDIRVLSETELHDLADRSLEVHGPEYGPTFRAMILFSAYSGLRLTEACNLKWSDVRFGEREVDVRVAKFDKPRTVLLLPEAAEALHSVPRRADTEYVFTSKRGQQLTQTSHYAIWNPVRGGTTAIDWHELRHFCAHHFYVTLGYSDELTAYQLGHSDAKLVRDLYGHGRQDALERLKARPPLRAVSEQPTSGTHKAAESAS